MCLNHFPWHMYLNVPQPLSVAHVFECAHHFSWHTRSAIVSLPNIYFASGLTLGTAAWKTKSVKLFEVVLLADIEMSVTVEDGSCSNSNIIFNPALSKAVTPSNGSGTKLTNNHAVIHGTIFVDLPRFWLELVMKLRSERWNLYLSCVE